MNECRFVCITLLSLLLAHPAMAASLTPAGLLLQMSKSAGELNYEGRLALAVDNRVSTLRLVHVTDGGQEWERLTELDGKHREVLVGQGDTLLLSGNAVAALLEPLSGHGQQTLEQRLAALQNSYRIELGEMDRVAGRTTQVLRFVPIDDARYGLTLWLDKDTSLLLRAEITEGRRRVETLVFTDMRVGKNIGVAEYRSARRWLTERHEGAMTPAGGAEAPIDWRLNLPAGFQSVRNKATLKRLNDVEVTSMTYSDGLASFTLFVEPLAPGGKLPSSKVRHIGALVSVGRVLESAGQSVLLTCVGNIPEKTAIALLNSAVHGGS